MSYSSFPLSCGIEDDLLSLDGSAEIGVPNGASLHQIDRPAEEGGGLLVEAEVLLREAHSLGRVELHREVEVAARRIEGAAHGRAEQAEPPHAVAAAEGPQPLSDLRHEPCLLHGSPLRSHSTAFGPELRGNAC